MGIVQSQVLFYRPVKQFSTNGNVRLKKDIGEQHYY